MSRSLLGAASLVAIATTLAACGGKNDKATFQAAVDSMSLHRDSTHRQVDTTKLGAAKTESILTKARKAP